MTKTVARARIGKRTSNTERENQRVPASEKDSIFYPLDFSHSATVQHSFEYRPYGTPPAALRVFCVNVKHAKLVEILRLLLPSAVRQQALCLLRCPRYPSARLLP
jgi:hypothetical protein